MNDSKIDREFLYHMYDATWEDIRHSRLQEWKMLEVVAFAFIALTGLGIQEEFREISIIFGVFIASFSFLGILVTLRHRKLFSEKMELIKNIENVLGLDKSSILPEAWKKKEKPVKIMRAGSTSFFLMTIYAVLSIFALTYIFFTFFKFI